MTTKIYSQGGSMYHPHSSKTDNLGTKVLLEAMGTLIVIAAAVLVVAMEWQLINNVIFTLTHLFPGG